MEMLFIITISNMPIDYCTGFFEGWWAHCCLAHDINYLNQVPKITADLELAYCVASSTTSPSLSIISYGIAGIMFIGVTFFGSYFYKKAKPKSINKDKI